MVDRVRAERKAERQKERERLAIPRLTGYFAYSAPLCVLIRCGPANYSHMTLWNTETDAFMPGQWTRGKVQYFNMTPDAKYAAIGLMGVHPRDGFSEQVAVVCRPPYFSGLEAWQSGLCFTTVIVSEGVLDTPGSGRPNHYVNATNACPLKRETSSSTNRNHAYYLEDNYRQTPRGFDRSGRKMDLEKGELFRDQQGRPVKFEDGKVFVMENEMWKMVFDANLFRPGPVPPPAWALEW